MLVSPAGACPRRCRVGRIWMRGRASGRRVILAAFVTDDLLDDAASAYGERRFGGGNSEALLCRRP